MAQATCYQILAYQISEFRVDGDMARHVSRSIVFVRLFLSKDYICLHSLIFYARLEPEKLTATFYSTGFAKHLLQEDRPPPQVSFRSIVMSVFLHRICFSEGNAKERKLETRRNGGKERNEGGEGNISSSSFFPSFPPLPPGFQFSLLRISMKSSPQQNID